MRPDLLKAVTDDLAALLEQNPWVTTKSQPSGVVWLLRVYVYDTAELKPVATLVVSDGCIRGMHCEAPNRTKGPEAPRWSYEQPDQMELILQWVRDRLTTVRAQ